MTQKHYLWLVRNYDRQFVYFLAFSCILVYIYLEKSNFIKYSEIQ